MKYLDLFSGVGGFALGITQSYENLQKLRIEDERQPKRASFRDKEGQREQLHKFSNERLSCIGFSEIDKYATQVYKKHFPNHKNYGDITQIDETALPDFDLLVGGFPCQAFSIAGKRGGFEDTRGTLFFDIARIIKEKQPRLLLLENVKGLLSHDQGATFTTIISTLDELGYDCQWQVLNSKNHGVPQNRERVFIVGHLRGTSRPEVFPFRESNELNRGKAPQGNDLAYCLQAGNDKHRGSYIKIGKDGKTKRDQKNAATLTAGGHSVGNHSDMDLLVEQTKIRRLTPTECERLQGFPDGWTSGLSDTQRYKCCGNAVTVNVIEDIINRLI